MEMRHFIDTNDFTKEELLESGAQALIAKPQELFDLL